MIFVYEHPDGRIIERSFRPGGAPKRVRVDGRWCKRAIVMPKVLGISASKSNGRDIDFVSDQLDVGLHGKFHKGRIIKNEHGEQRLHFGSRKQVNEFKSAWNASPEAAKHGRLSYGETDNWADDVRRGYVVDS